MSKLSVIVPVHNTEKYLEKCVESLTSQTLTDIEIILVENASKDGSLQKCHECAEKDSRISVLSFEIGDLSYARNRGVEAAKSEFVAFVDSDDTVNPNMYQDLYTFAVENNLDIVYSNYAHVYDDCMKYAYPETGQKTVLTPKQLLELNFKHKVTSSACTMIARKSLFDTLHFPEGRFFEDRAFTFKLINEAKMTGYIDKAYYNYYQRAGSIFHMDTWKKMHDWLRADLARLEFIAHTDHFSLEKKALLAKKPTYTFFRQLRRMGAIAKTDQEKEVIRKLYHKGRHLVPKECKTSLKTKIRKFRIRTFYI